MSTIIICAILVVICFFGIRSSMKRVSNGCCGTGDDVKKVKAEDTDVSHYPYHFEVEVSKALGRLYQVDNNAYAFMFDEDVYNHFTDYVFHQPRERLKWGYGRIMEHEKLYTLVRSLLEKEKTAGSDFESEILRLKKVCEKQYTLLEKYTDKITEVLKETYLN